MRRIAGLSELAGEFDTLLCDVWGVLHNGVAAFPAAVEALTSFRAGGGRVVLITNAPRPRASVAKQLAQLGVTGSAYDAIVTSGDVTRELIAERANARFFHLGPERDLPLYDGLGIRLVGEPEAEVVSCTGLFNDTSETPDDYREQLGRFRERRMPMICANPDLVVERGKSLVYCAGALAALYRELGGEAVIVGKPHPAIYEAAMSEIRALGGSRVLAIGDGLPTDIRGAVDKGIPVLFVTGGIHAADFGDHANPDRERVAARLAAEGLSAIAYLPKLVWNGGGAPA